MREENLVSRTESRWPVIMAILILLILVIVTPGRLRFVPQWIPLALVSAAMLPSLIFELSARKERWLRIEHIVMIVFSIIIGLITWGTVVTLITAIISPEGEATGLQLLSSGIISWFSNVIVFSLLYWQTDRGGPEHRARNHGSKPDWLFPQTGVPELVRPDWRPTFIDYLFLGFTTATAFSTTDVAPLTSRAKIMMLIEAVISLVIIVIIGARAINIIGN
jgi:uncharacterized membrane protein